MFDVLTNLLLVSSKNIMMNDVLDDMSSEVLLKFLKYPSVIEVKDDKLYIKNSDGNYGLWHLTFEQN